MRALPRRGRSEMCVPPTVAGSTQGPVDSKLPLIGTAGTRFYSQAFPTAQHQQLEASLVSTFLGWYPTDKRLTRVTFDCIDTGFAQWLVQHSQMTVGLNASNCTCAE